MACHIRSFAAVHPTEESVQPCKHSQGSDGVVEPLKSPSLSPLQGMSAYLDMKTVLVARGSKHSVATLLAV